MTPTITSADDLLKVSKAHEKDREQINEIIDSQETSPIEYYHLKMLHAFYEEKVEKDFLKCIEYMNLYDAELKRFDELHTDLSHTDEDLLNFFIFHASVENLKLTVNCDEFLIRKVLIMTCLSELIHQETEQMRKNTRIIHEALMECHLKMKAH